MGSSMNERDQMLFISTDEGSSFKSQAVSFSPDTLTFHPQDQDKLLAYCRKGRVGNWALVLAPPSRFWVVPLPQLLSHCLVSGPPPAFRFRGPGPQLDSASGARLEGPGLLVSPPPHWFEGWWEGVALCARLRMLAPDWLCFQRINNSHDSQEPEPTDSLQVTGDFGDENLDLSRRTRTPLWVSASIGPSSRTPQPEQKMNNG